MFPPEILQVEVRDYSSGRGRETELSCAVQGEPRPTVRWYTGGQAVNLTERVVAQQAGVRHILTIHSLQPEERGEYVCYASNSVGSVQRSVAVPGAAAVSQPAVPARLLRHLQRAAARERQTAQKWRRGTELALAAVRAKLASVATTGSGTGGARKFLRQNLLFPSQNQIRSGQSWSWLRL